MTTPGGQDDYFILFTLEETKRLRELLTALGEARSAGNGSWTDAETDAYVLARSAVEDFLAPVTAGLFVDPEYLEEVSPDKYAGWQGRPPHWSDECVTLNGCRLA